MSQPEILSTLAVNHGPPDGPSFLDAHEIFGHSCLETITWTQTAQITGAPSGHQVGQQVYPADNAEDYIFPSLPPLGRGHPDVHLRNGIMKSSTEIARDSDAEKAFFVADLSVVYRQHQRWKQWLPQIQPFYAVKCNPDPYVVRLLAALGTGFDCASSLEMRQILLLGGVHPSRIIYANPCKPTSHIRSAAKSGVNMMTFDNVDELYKVARTHPHAKLVLRILTEDSKSLCQFGIKFGASLQFVPGLLSTAKGLGLDVIGVSFHVGSGCYDPSLYREAIIRARHAFRMGKAAGYDFSLLDVGGGFEDALFEKAACILTRAIDEFFADLQGITIIGEPGRFYVSTAFKLATNIIARRAPAIEASRVEEGHEETKTMYYISDGVYGSFNCILFDHQVVLPYVLSLNGSFHVCSTEPLSPASVWGPTCDSFDCVCPSTELPSALRVGDWLGFDNMGAYTVCAASQFNGFELSRVVYTSGGAGSKEVRDALHAFASKGYGL